MKLAEALILRADYQKRIEQLKSRLLQNIQVQEGDDPYENPKELMKELTDLLSQLQDLVQKINKTNLLTPFNETESLADVLVKRNIIGQEFTKNGRMRVLYDDRKGKNACWKTLCSI